MTSKKGVAVLGIKPNTADRTIGYLERAAFTLYVFKDILKFKVLGCYAIKGDRCFIEEFYPEKVGESYFNRMVQYLSEDMVYFVFEDITQEQLNLARYIIGPTNPKSKDEDPSNSLRSIFLGSLDENLFHFTALIAEGENEYKVLLNSSAVEKNLYAQKFISNVVAVNQGYLRKVETRIRSYHDLKLAS